MTTHFPTRELALALVLGVFLSACNKAPAPAPATSSKTELPSMENPIEKHPEDLQVTKRVQDALMLDPGLKAFAITVVTTNGDVRLSGVLDTQAQIDTAMKLASATAGVHSLHPELTLKK